MDIPISTVDQAIYTSQPGYVDQLATFAADANQVNIFLVNYSVGLSRDINANSNTFNLVSG